MARHIIALINKRRISTFKQTR